MRIKSRPGPAREGQGPKNKAQRQVPPRTRQLAKPRPPRDWAHQNQALVARGDVEIWVDRRAWSRGRGRGVGAGRGRPHPVEVITAAVVIATLFDLPLRQCEGFCRFLVRSLGLDVSVPDYTTICRRRRELQWSPPALRSGQVIVIDATGVTVRNPGPWMRYRFGDTPAARFMKLHVAIDSHTGEVLAHQVTDAWGRGSGDVSVGPGLITQAARVSKDPTCVLADRAYDASSCYQAAESIHSRLVTPPKDKARRGVHPHRDEHLGQIGLLGPPTWKKRVGYGQRSQVESVFAAMRATFTDKVRSKTIEGVIAELDARMWLHNQMVTRHPNR